MINNLYQLVTIVERIITNACNTVRDCDAHQTIAIVKCSITNTCDAIWDCDAHQTIAIVKCIPINIIVLPIIVVR